MISYKLKNIIFILLILINPSLLLAQDDIKGIGKKLYFDHACWQCHGLEGQGSSASPATPRIAPTLYPYEVLSILTRKPPPGMPAYSSKILSNNDLLAIYEYVKSIPAPPEIEDIEILNDLSKDY